MLANRQFSIRFVLLEMAALGVALALIRQGLIWRGDPGGLCVIASLFVIGGALGAVFGSVIRGLVLTVAGICVGSMFLPA